MTTDRLNPALRSGVPGCAWILKFDPQGQAQPGTAEDLKQIESGATGSFVWAHFDRSDARLPGVFQGLPVLDGDARDALLANVDHQFVEAPESLVYGALIDHEATIAGRTYETDFLRFAFGPSFLITSRRRPLQSAEATRVQLSAGLFATSPLLLFERIANNICDCVAKMTREIAAQLDHIEDRIVFDGSGREQRAPLGRARREAVRLARQVGGMHSTFQRLAETSTEQELEQVYEVSTGLLQRSDALVRDVSNLQDRARLLQEEVNAILTLETNDRLYILTIVTTLILPATFVTGLFGMNTKELYFAESQNGTLWATLLCVIASALALLVLRRFGLAQQAISDAPKPKSKARNFSTE